MAVGLAASVLVLGLSLGFAPMASAAQGSGSAAPGVTLPLGTFEIVPGTPSCPAGYSLCQRFRVTGCTGVAAPGTGVLADAAPTATDRGTVVLFSGSGGTTWWDPGTGLTPSFRTALQSKGFRVIQVRWTQPWLASSPGEDAGTGHLACRPSTVVRWVHDNRYAPVVPPTQTGVCGFCVSGNSGGASQAAYGLAFYGLDDIVDALLPTSGPPHASQAQGCLRAPEDVTHYYAESELATVDSAHGFSGTVGPCAAHDPSFTTRWTEESVDTGASDLVHPETRVAILLGRQDCTSAPAHAADYFDALVAAGSPTVTLSVVDGMAHDIQASQSGLLALRRLVLGLSATPASPCYPLV